VSYIGVQPAKGQYRKLRNFESSFDGVTTAFQLEVDPGGSAYYVVPGSANQLIVSLGGVIQEPNVDYTVSSSQITFTTAPAAGLSCFIIQCGDALNTGTPGDGTVTTSKLAADLTVDLDSGTAASPSLTFDANTGLFSPGSDILAISTGGSERLRADADGLKFNGDTAAANGLDDYEEGTWTVELYDAATGGNVSSTSSTGGYTKIGNVVTVWFAISNISTSGLTSGNILYFTLPFSSGNVSSRGSVLLDTVTFTGYVISQINANASRGVFSRIATGSTDAQLAVSAFTSGTSDMGVTITYRI